MATVKLFEFKLTDPVWKPTPVVGTVALLLHKPTKGLFFQITDHKTFDSLFLYRLNTDLQYHASSEHFHRFKSDQGYFAFSFFSLEEAQVFAVETENLIDLYMHK
jgi:hypothetical protein